MLPWRTTLLRFSPSSSEFIVPKVRERGRESAEQILLANFLICLHRGHFPFLVPSLELRARPLKSSFQIQSLMQWGEGTILLIVIVFSVKNTSPFLPDRLLPLAYFELLIRVNYSKEVASNHWTLSYTLKLLSCKVIKGSDFIMFQNFQFMEWTIKIKKFFNIKLIEFRSPTST